MDGTWVLSADFVAAKLQFLQQSTTTIKRWSLVYVEAVSDGIGESQKVQVVELAKLLLGSQSDFKGSTDPLVVNGLPW